MTQAYDPYYRDFPSNLLPARTPFTRAGQGDAGQVFVYMTRKWVRWSMVLDRTRLDLIHDEARQCIPPGFSQFWLLEKRYSTARPGGRARTRPSLENYPFDRFTPPVETERPATGNDDNHFIEKRSSFPVLEEKLLIVLREPPQRPDGKGDVLSYHLREAEALRAAEAYTRRSQRRAVVALLLWDEFWF